MRIIASTILVLLICANAARGQILADHVPDTAVEYFAWRGADSLGPQYDQSHLKQFVDSSQIQQFIATNFPQWFASIARLGQGNDQLISATTEVAKVLWKHPAVFCICLKPNATHADTVGLICDAGSDADDLQSKISDLITLGNNKSIHLAIAGNILTLSLVGDLSQIDPQKSLATDPEFVSAMSHCLKDGAAMYYIR